ncbi:unnamed protein product [Musa acuminata subsp. malaccensis]|uniref:(wild Malaysian banana) hypothetical protein n=1 Tax=Musa acuminata subsp. malaccensis TaxID=214687 RepID=A0A804HMP8_MUSAM|nr:unnamed protein product [Musa acuminata subsp. malaccensis]
MRRVKAEYLAAMFGGSRSGVFSLTKAFLNPSLPTRSAPLKPSRLCFPYARRSSQANSNESDYGDVREGEDAVKTRKAFQKAKDSMQEYLKEAKEKAEEAKEETGSVAAKAKETAEQGTSTMTEKSKATANAAREKASGAAEKTKETAETAKERAKSVGERAKERAEEGVERAQSIGERAKQTMQEAWEAAKETTHKIKETVVGKDQDTPKDAGNGGTKENVRVARESAEDDARKHGRDELKD